MNFYKKINIIPLFFFIFYSAYSYDTQNEISNYSFATKKANTSSNMVTRSDIDIDNSDSTKTNAFYILARRIYSPGSHLPDSNLSGPNTNSKAVFSSAETYAAIQMLGAKEASKVGSIAIGDGNFAEESYSTAIGGSGNRAEHTYATSIGSYLEASGKGATGYHSGIYSAYNGLTRYSYAIVFGGLSGTASGYGSVVIGGKNSKAEAENSAAISSPDSSSTGTNSGIFAGQNHSVSGVSSAVIAGEDSIVSGDYSVAIGSKSSRALGDYSVIAGGVFHAASPDYSVIVGGQLGLINTPEEKPTWQKYSGIFGGRGNMAKGHGAVVIGGYENEISTSDTVIIAGHRNKVNDSGVGTPSHSGIVGGANNKLSGKQSVILSGDYNEIFTIGNYSAIVGGSDNKVRSRNSLVTGQSNESFEYSDSSFIGGKDNFSAGTHQFIMGQGIGEPRNHTVSFGSYSYSPLLDHFPIGGKYADTKQGTVMFQQYYTERYCYSHEHTRVLYGPQVIMEEDKRCHGRHLYFDYDADLRDNTPLITDRQVDSPQDLDRIIDATPRVIKYRDPDNPTLEAFYNIRQGVVDPDVKPKPVHIEALALYNSRDDVPEPLPEPYTLPIAPNHPVFVIGNGTSNQNRDNALYLSMRGDLTLSGELIASSDKRLKTNFKPYKAGLKEILALNPVHFTWKRWQTQTVGLIAQDVYKVLPDIVQKGDDDENAKDWTEIKEQWSMSYDKIPLVLINAVKEKQAVIEKNQQTIEYIGKIIKRLEAEIAQLKQEKNI